MSEENKFIDALRDLLKDQTFELHNGQLEILNSIHFARLPSTITNNTNIVIVPKGPVFPITTLGRGGGWSARERFVRIDVYVFHDGYDEETVIKTISDITEFIVRKVLDASKDRMAGVEQIDVDEIEYDWASAQEQDSASLEVTSVAVIPIIATYRR